MSNAPMTPAMRRLVDLLGEVGPRWGLQAEPCRVHGYLYLLIRPVSEAELCEALMLDHASLESALAWLAEYRLIQRVDRSRWQTGSDPWDLMVRTLEERRRREVGPALEVLRDCRRMALAEPGTDKVVGAQIGKLLALAEDLAAIDGQARRLSPKALRQVIGLGGSAARLFDRAFGRSNRQ